MYCASSSLRAWTERLPSDVPIICLSSLKESDSWTASALTIPRRRRSWIRRSIAAGAEGFAPSSLRSLGASLFAAGLRSPIVVPRDPETEDDVQAAEAGRHPRVAPRGRREQRAHAEEHEAGAHDLHRERRERTGGDDAGAVAQEPRAGEDVEEPGSPEPERQARARRDRRDESGSEARGRSSEERVAALAELVRHVRRADEQREERGADPGDEPADLRRGLPGGERGEERDPSHEDAAPAGDGGERGGALHGRADEPQVVARPGVQGGRGLPLMLPGRIPGRIGEA